MARGLSHLQSVLVVSLIYLLAFQALQCEGFGLGSWFGNHGRNKVTHHYFIKALSQQVDTICLKNSDSPSHVDFDNADTFLVGRSAGLTDGNVLCPKQTVYATWHKRTKSFQKLSRPPIQAALRGWQVSVWRAGDTELVSLLIKNDSPTPLWVRSSNSNYRVSQSRSQFGTFGQLVAPSSSFERNFTSLPLVTAFLAESWTDWTRNQFHAAVLVNPSMDKGTSTLLSYLFYKPVDDEEIDFYLYEAVISRDIEDQNRRRLRLRKLLQDYSYNAPDYLDPSADPPDSYDSPDYDHSNSGTASTASTFACPRGRCFRKSRVPPTCKPGRSTYPMCLYVCLCG